MIVPASAFCNLLFYNNLRHLRKSRNVPDASGIENLRPNIEHFAFRKQVAQITRAILNSGANCFEIPISSAQSIPMHNDEIPVLERLKADISARLRAACAHFPQHEFEELVQQIAQFELKYARSNSQPTGEQDG